jgi:hypothetical protein
MTVAYQVSGHWSDLSKLKVPDQSICLNCVALAQDINGARSGSTPRTMLRMRFVFVPELSEFAQPSDYLMRGRTNALRSLANAMNRESTSKTIQILIPAIQL